MGMGLTGKEWSRWVGLGGTEYEIFLLVISNFSNMYYPFNFHNVIITFQDLIDGEYTIVAVSFRAILNQVMDNLGLAYMGGEPYFKRDLRFQAKLSFCRAS